MIAVEEYLHEERFPCTDLTFNIAEKCIKTINFWKFMSDPNGKNRAYLNGHDK